MNSRLVSQLLALGALVVTAFFLVDPMHLSMPDNMHMATLAGVVVITGIFAALVLAERSGDEREDAHRALAGRIAFFVGTVVLLVGITLQTFAHALDAWLVYALVAMTVGKVIARFVAERTG